MKTIFLLIIFAPIFAFSSQTSQPLQNASVVLDIPSQSIIVAGTTSGHKNVFQSFKNILILGSISIPQSGTTIQCRRQLWNCSIQNFSIDHQGTLYGELFADNDQDGNFEVKAVKLNIGNVNSQNLVHFSFQNIYVNWIQDRYPWWDVENKDKDYISIVLEGLIDR